MNGSILIVDDDAGVAAGLTLLLEELGYEVHHAENARDAYVAFSKVCPDIVLLDVELPDASGIDVLQQLKANSEWVPVIMISGAGLIDRVVACMKQGAETFLQKPFDAQTLTLAVAQAQKSIALHRELAARRREQSSNDDGARVLGASEPAVALAEMVRKVAPSASPVLIEGESGSGKGVVARLLHQLSPRARAPFVDLNCAGLSKELLESELFGHEKGAFTSASATKQGLFEVAAGGTLFLDEIGELEVSIQARLLKALEDRKFRRVGGVRDLHADFRLIAATNRTLRDEVAAGTFRKDLYYRLNVVTIRVPPLRERAADIPLLALDLLRKLAAETGRRPPRLSDQAIRKLTEYAWPGNVRELRNALERALLVTGGTEIRADDLSLEGDDSPVEAGGFLPHREWEVRTLDEVTVDYMRATVAAVDGNMRKAARLLAVSPSTLYAKLKND